MHVVPTVTVQKMNTHHKTREHAQAMYNNSETH